jgi:hypothetical protein
MNTGRPSVILVITTILSMPALAAAQEPVRSFDQLNTRLKVGDTIWVTDAQGGEVKGRVNGLSPASLQLKAEDNVQEFSAARVGTVRIQPKDGLRNGVLWGALVGFVGGALSCGANSQCAGDEGGAGIAAGLGILGAAAGAGIGAGIDAAIKGPKLVVYRAPAAGSSARLTIAPVMTPRTRGVAMSFSF